MNYGNNTGFSGLGRGQVVNFEEASAKAKSGVQEAIAVLSRVIRKHKLTYSQLRYVYREARRKAGIAAPRVKKSLIELPTVKELSDFYAVIKDPVHRLLFRTLENTGARISELCDLKIEHVDLGGNLIFIKNGKGGRDRVVPIGNQLKDQISLFINGKKNVYLFESRRHTRYSSRRVEQICAQYKRAAKIEKRFSPHTLRHIFNSRLATLGVPRELRELLSGHQKGSRVQDIYTHLSLDGFKDQLITLLDSPKWNAGAPVYSRNFETEFGGRT